MTDKESCIICELEEMLDESMESNESLVAENSELKDVLIATLLELGQYQRENIERLMFIVDGNNGFPDEDDESRGYGVVVTCTHCNLPLSNKYRGNHCDYCGGIV